MKNLQLMAVLLAGALYLSTSAMAQGQEAAAPQAQAAPAAPQAAQAEPAQAEAPEQAAEADAKAEKKADDPVECRKFDVMNSRLRKHTVCKTKSQWLAISRGAQDELMDAQRRTSPQINSD